MGASCTYQYRDSQFNHSHAYLLPRLTQIVDHHFQRHDSPRRMFDLGCGNGSVANYFGSLGYKMSGVDPSADGVKQANDAFQGLNIHVGSAYDDLRAGFGTFPVVYSLEVVEHVYDPRSYARTLFSLVEDGGLAVVSTPYHGYVKNLAVIAGGGFDRHFNPLWDHGHIKFWSRKTLRTLLTEAGFADVAFHRVGRIPLVAKSMIACARKA
jgi:2-polyprenyl-6-hydroxyphenyl methylase/3-demethylubiquinone-9 3-methyltransferase